MYSRKDVDVGRLYADNNILYNRLEPPGTLVSVRGPGANPLWITRDDCNHYRFLYTSLMTAEGYCPQPGTCFVSLTDLDVPVPLH